MFRLYNKCQKFRPRINVEEIDKVNRQGKVVAPRINISENSFAYEEADNRSFSFKGLLSTTLKLGSMSTKKNAIQHPWKREFGFAFSLFSLISRVLRKVQQEKAHQLIIVHSKPNHYKNISKTLSDRENP